MSPLFSSAPAPEQDLAPAAFAGALHRSYADALEFHGDLDLPRPVYESRVTSIVSTYAGDPTFGAAAARFTGGLHTNDLYLSIACAERSESAWQRFRCLYFRYLSEIFKYVNFARDCPVELADSLLTDMFLPDRSGRCRIGSYEGRCSLQTWLKVVVNNRQINHRQNPANRSCPLEVLQEPRDDDAALIVESNLRHSRYGRVFMQAFLKACQALTPRERELLLWRYDQNLKLVDIASRVGVHQSNVTRHIDKLCGRLRASVIERLEKDNGLSSAAIAECLLTVFDEFDHPAGILAALKEETPRKKDEPARAPAILCAGAV